MKKITAIIAFVLYLNVCWSQDVNILKQKIVELQIKVDSLQKVIDHLKVINTKSTFNIKYEVESEDKTTDFLITFWDKDGKVTGNWFRSGWKYIFTTSDINQQLFIKANAGYPSKKKVTLNIYVEDKLVKSDTQFLKGQMDGPSCQVILSDLVQK